MFLNGNPIGFLFSAFLLLSFNVAVLHFSTKSLVSLTQIMIAVKEISKGNIDYKLDNSQVSVAFLDFAKDIQSIQFGLKKAVDDAIKGERMKTELITNVSHDLKTPLTSIVNYVDLLKKEELDNKTAYEYINILEDKSARLKQLIEDLVEASKASSGNIAVNAEKVDLHELVMQACGEYEEKIRKTGLDIRVSSIDKNLLVLADGKHTWRIVENLISNVLKYSLPGSRVYINLDKNEKFGMLTIKNISAFPLNIQPEQLTERFIRGDESRTTEGSGLGLSIAQSLTSIQGGRFKIEIDGDLFKAIVEIPLWFEDFEEI
jgi:signal transduction histidine kinase